MRFVLIPLVLLAGCGSRQFVQACPPTGAPNEAIELSAAPFLQLRRSHVRLRFESVDLVRLPVSVGPEGDRCPTVLDPDQDRLERTFEHPSDGSFAELPDVAGDHTLHTATLDELTGPVTWQVHTGPTDDHGPLGVTGPAPVLGEPATLVFTANLLPPVQTDVLALAAEQSPTAAFLLGDLQDSDEPTATWSRLLHDAAPISATGYLHTLAAEGDTEGTEYEDLYLRWFGGQGRAGGDDRYYSVDIAGVRIIALDGDDARLAIEGSSQWRWLESELSDVGEAAGLREAIVVMHKGAWTLAEQVPVVEQRDTLAPLLESYGVRLVVQGSGRLYERFEVNGVTWLNEGGGGAALSAPDHRADRDPDAVAARALVSATHGLTRLDIAADGALTLVRLDVTGVEVDRVTLPAPGT